MQATRVMLYLALASRSAALSLARSEAHLIITAALIGRRGPRPGALGGLVIGGLAGRPGPGGRCVFSAERPTIGPRSDLYEMYFMCRRLAFMRREYRYCVSLWVVGVAYDLVLGYNFVCQRCGYRV